MSQESLKRTPSLLLGATVLFCLLNLFGLLYLYHQQQLETVKIKALKTNLNMAFDSSIQSVQNQQNMITNDLQVIQKKLNRPHHAQTYLLQIKWLIQQAKLQLNIIYQPQAAITLLNFAHHISQKNQWDTLNEALLQDINHIKILNLTPPQTLIQHIETIKTSILAITPKLQFAAKSETKNKLPLYLDTLKPFIQIEKIHKSHPSIIPPTEQVVILQNMLLLLPQIQMAGISHHQELFKLLINELQQQWSLIADKFPSSVMNETLEKLDTEQFILDKPMTLESFAAVKPLYQQFNAREPK
jgi:hypothetical protein